MQHTLQKYPNRNRKLRKNIFVWSLRWIILVFFAFPFFTSLSLSLSVVVILLECFVLWICFHSRCIFLIILYCNDCKGKLNRMNTEFAIGGLTENWIFVLFFFIFIVQSCKWKENKDTSWTRKKKTKTAKKKNEKLSFQNAHNHICNTNDDMNCEK